MTALIIVVGYALAWLTATTIALRVLPVQVKCSKGYRASFCSEYHNAACRVPRLPDSSDVTMCAGVGFAWPIVTLPALAWLIATGQLRKDMAAEARRKALAADIARLEKEAGL